MSRRNGQVSTGLVYSLAGYYAGIALKQNSKLIEGRANFPRLNKLIRYFVDELPQNVINDVNQMSMALNAGIADLNLTGEAIGVDMVHGVFYESTEELVAGLIGFLLGYNRDKGLGNKVCAGLVNAGFYPSGYDFTQPKVHELVFIITNCQQMSYDKGVITNIGVPTSNDDLHHITATTLRMLFNVDSFKMDGHVLENTCNEIVGYILSAS